MQEPAAVAQEPVRDDLEQVERPRAGAASSRAGRSASSARTSAPCAGTRSRSSASASRTRPRRGLVDRAPAALHHQVRQREVVPEARVDLDVVGAAHRVDRAVAAGDRAEPRLRRAHARARSASRAPSLFEPSAAWSCSWPQTYATSGSANVRTSLRSASGAHVAFASENATISPLGLAHRAVLRRDLAAARVADHARAGAAAASSSVRSVDASEVTTSSSLSRRVVEREQVLDPARDHRLLVVGGDDHGDGRLDRRAFRTRPRAHARRARRRRAGRGRASTTSAAEARARRGRFSSEHAGESSAATLDTLRPMLGGVRLCFVVGARPNFMKARPCIARSAEPPGHRGRCSSTPASTTTRRCRTSSSTSSGCPQPDVFLGVGSGTHAEQTARALVGIEQVLLERAPASVVVAGDVNSTLAAALAAVKLEHPGRAHRGGAPQLRPDDAGGAQPPAHRPSEQLLLAHSESAIENLAARRHRPPSASTSSATR